MTETKVFKSDLKVPKFATEAEEAKWWFENQDEVFEEFKKAAKAGTLGRGGARRLFAERGIPFRKSQGNPIPTTTIRLDPEDIAKARVQAAKRGLRYQTYLKMIIQLFGTQSLTGCPRFSKRHVRIAALRQGLPWPNRCSFSRFIFVSPARRRRYQCLSRNQSSGASLCQAS